MTDRAHDKIEPLDMLIAKLPHADALAALIAVKALRKRVADLQRHSKENDEAYLQENEHLIERAEAAEARDAVLIKVLERIVASNPRCSTPRALFYWAQDLARVALNRRQP